MLYGSASAQLGNVEKSMGYGNVNPGSVIDILAHKSKRAISLIEAVGQRVASELNRGTPGVATTNHIVNMAHKAGARSGAMTVPGL
jgi:hypothetical protein